MAIGGVNHLPAIARRELQRSNAAAHSLPSR